MSVLQPETVVVQSVGMGRWISLRLAEAHGICANLRFPFPQRFVAEIFQATVPEAPATDFFSRELLPWRVMRVLPGLIERSQFEAVRHYLGGARPELKLYQLSNKIAEAFDRYLVFRPRMILDWDAGKGNDWQAILWRELAEGKPHQPMLARQFAGKLRTGAGRELLPPRVSIFGISSLPQFYLDIIEEIARETVVHLFVLEPTPEWWSDIRSEREELRARRRAPESAQLDLRFERGNPVLASLGKLGREFLEAITALDPAQEHECFRAPQGGAMLTEIQRDIFQLEDATGGAKRPVAPGDRSLQFHSCHSPMREMEVLHDQLLALFEQQPDLKPHDVVVMAPDISVYAPFIEAVFATAPEEVRFPFSIADRGARAENGVIDTFLRILEAAGSRFPASSVMTLLESVPLQRHFDLAEPDLEIIRTWIEKTGIRWGIDAAHRAELGLPEFAENSWRAGLDRLLLGYAAPARGEKLFAGVLAFDEVEGNLAETLGHFAEFAETLFATARALQEPLRLSEWEETLRDLAATFFAADDEREPELRQLRHVVEGLRETATHCDFEAPVPLDVLVAHLEQALARTETNAGFLVGRVTFCALKPMRAIPFRVVCLVGMNGTAYPRQSHAPAFDLVAQAPRPGDRSTRDDDRYLFLEAFLSARDVFYLSYVGQSSRDNSPLPPSVLVSELLDYAEESFAIPETAPLVTRHRLQPFSPAYFASGSGLFSYSAENCAASEAAAEKRSEPPPFVSQPISEPEAEWRQVDAGQLIRFFANPAKFFVEERLALRLPRLEEMLEEAEPFEIHALAKYKLEQDLVTRALRGESLEPLLPVLRANGELPPGHAGDARLRRMCEAAEEFAALVKQHLAEAPDAPRELRLALDEFSVDARLDQLYRGRLVHYRLTTCKPKDLLIAWIHHLIANCERPTESVLITTDKKSAPVLRSFPVTESETARSHLSDLLQLYWRGLREPLPLFPKSSLLFAEASLAGKKDPLQAARKKWESSPAHYETDFGEPPESADAYFRLVFRNLADPLDSQFQELALTLFGPLLQGMRQ